MINLNYLMDHIISVIQDYFEYILKKHNKIIDNLLIRAYLNKIENRLTFKIKTRYYLEFLTPETVKLLGSTENKKAKNKNGENVPHLEITEVVLVHSQPTFQRRINVVSTLGSTLK